MTGTDDPGAAARRLVRTLDRATLATRRRAGTQGADGPYAGLVLTACAHDATPLLLISGLAEHTKDIAADPRVALLYDGTGGLDEPLTGARTTVLGRARRSEAAGDRARYLARHPSAEAYAGFGDFALWRVEVERAHLVAGFGRIHWIERGALMFEVGAGAALQAAEAEIVAHMNGEHTDAVALYAARLLGQAPGPWRMTGVDPEGCDLRLGGRAARLDFARIVASPDEARAELVRLVKEARTRSTG